VSIDGGPATTIDTAGPAAVGSAGLASEPVFSASNLAPGPHTLVITVTGTTNSGGAFVVVDAFDVTGGTSAASATTRVEDTDPAVNYTGTDWTHGNFPQATNGTFAESHFAGNSVTFTFTGTGVSWIGFKASNNGIARVSVDGAFVTNVDSYGPDPVFQPILFTTSGLAPGQHTLTIEVTQTKNPASSDTWVLVDAFDVTP
jgi:hypothetical protein